MIGDDATSVVAATNRSSAAETPSADLKPSPSLSAHMTSARPLAAETPQSVGPLKGAEGESQLSAAITEIDVARLTPNTDLTTAKQLRFSTPSQNADVNECELAEFEAMWASEDLQNDLDELDKYLVGADFSPDSTPASTTMSDDEIAALETEIFGFDDIEEVIGTFLAGCIDTAVCEITAHSLLVPDPVPSHPVDKGTLLNVESVLDIDVGVPIAAAGGSTAGGAVQAMLDVRAPQALDRAGAVDLPASDLDFAWDAGRPAPATDVGRQRV